jgi:hypothetical protein
LRRRRSPTMRERLPAWSCNIQFVMSPSEMYEFRGSNSRMLLRLSGWACPNVIRGPGGWLARVKRMREDICDNSVQEGRLWLRDEHRVELACAAPPIGAGLDTSPPKRLPSRRSGVCAIEWLRRRRVTCADSVSLSALFECCQGLRARPRPPWRAIRLGNVAVPHQTLSASYVTPTSRSPMTSASRRLFLGAFARAFSTSVLRLNTISDRQ